ncbi:MAG: response regulator transcription factor [Pseudohongiella sp.]|nr:response regulator transcription factor [Pseudohongiella sp.]
MDIQTPATVFLVDDDEDLRRVIALWLESVGMNIQEYATAEDFLACYESSQSGCLLLDIYLPGMSGLELQQELIEKDIQIPTIIMTSQGDVSTAVQAMKAGAIDFIEKPLNEEQLLERLRECLILDSSQRDKESRQENYSRRLADLTRRENEVMELMVAGKMNKVIAAELNISQRTVEDHRAKIMAKLKVKTIADVVRIYLLSQY